MFYAISGIGWARGETAQEAFETYLRIQESNFGHLTRDEILSVGGQVLEAPAGAEGFVIGFEDSWTDADQSPLSEIDYPEQVVAWIGVLPPWAEPENLKADDPIRVRMAALSVFR